MELIIIDKLQKIWETGGGAYSYANDNEMIGKLRELAEQTKESTTKSYLRVQPPIQVKAIKEFNEQFCESIGYVKKDGENQYIKHHNFHSVWVSFGY